MNSGTENIQQIDRMFKLLKSIRDPMPIGRFTSLEHTGNAWVDALLTDVSTMLLTSLYSQGMIKMDAPDHPNAHIYGLTDDGEKMAELFYSLVKPNLTPQR